MPYSKDAMVWLSTDEIIRKIPCTCIDGRTQGMRYSVAGGSLGIILQTLAALQAESGRRFQVAEIVAYIQLFARTVGPVYLHSDQHTMDLIVARMGLSPDTRLEDLTPEQQRSFRELAAQPSLQGCGHIKLMMNHEDVYGISSTLIERTLQAFLTLYFDRQPHLIFDILPGDHHEREALFVDDQDSVDPSATTALYQETPMDDNRFFCHRPLKKTLFQRYLTAIAASDLPGHAGALREDMVSALLDSHNTAAEHTLTRLAPHLPVEHLHL